MKIHIVQKGDTIWDIAKNYGVDFEQVKELNPQLSSPDMIMPGMKIKIPSTTKKVKKEVGHVKETKKQPAPKPIQQITEDDKHKPKQIQHPAYPQQHIPKMPTFPTQEYPSMPEYEKTKQKKPPKKEEKLTLPKYPSLDKSLGTAKKPDISKEQPEESIHHQQPMTYPCYQAMPMPHYCYHLPYQPCSCGQQMMYPQMPAGGMYPSEQMYPYPQSMWQQQGMPGYPQMRGPSHDWQGSQQSIQQWQSQTPHGLAQSSQQGTAQPQQGHTPGQHDHQSPYVQESYPTPPLYPTYRDPITEETEDE